MIPTQKFVKISVFIFGSFSFGWVLGTVFHELGHAIAMWATGGIVSHITINPLSWSYTYYDSTPKYPEFTAWAGVIIGSILGSILLFGVSKWTTPYLVPFSFSGFAPLLLGGGYYLVDTFISTKGDASSLLHMGVPKYVVLSVGSILLAMGIYCTIRIVHRIGITPQDTFIKRVALLGSGIVPYFLLTLAYAIIYAREDALTFSIAIIMALFFVVVVAWASLKSLKQGMIAGNIEWKHTIFAALLGLSAIVVPYLIAS